MHHFASLVILLIPFTSLAQAWELKKEADSIQVYTRSVSNSPIKEFKAVAQINASSEKILAVLKDVPSYPQWIEDVNYTKILNSAEDQLSFYYQMDLPWPMKDRDLALHMQISTSPGEISVNLSSAAKEVPLDQDYIRMYTVEGEWIITRVDDNTSDVVHRFLADPEGSLPAWVVNLFIVDGPFKSMKNLRQFVKTMN